METADAIRVAIAAEQRALQQARQELADSSTLTTEADERRQLRRQLNDLREQTAEVKSTTRSNMKTVQAWDADMPKAEAGHDDLSPVHKLGECQMSCNEDVVIKEHVWKIEGMSWLIHALEVGCLNCISTPGEYTIAATGDAVDFVYNPDRDEVDCMEDGPEHCASLAMRFWRKTNSTLRYRIFIRRCDGQFVQWGAQGDFTGNLKEYQPIGPDVVPAPGPAKGVFGMSHADLLQSEWVLDDVLTVKFELELRPGTGMGELQPKRLKVSVPPPSLVPNLLSLLEGGRRSDLAIVVKGERMMAHSLVLAARCDVFHGLLQSGMQESESKEVVVEDCEPNVFKAFLRYLYSDDFSQVHTCMESHSAQSSSEGGEAAGIAATKTAFIQGVLSVSNKYQVSRLALWCEQQLCDLIAVESVCAMWVQAYLHDAKRLEEVCLAHIKENMEKVASTPCFAKVSSAWPQLLLKLSLLSAGMSSDSAAAALSAHEDAVRKRKRE